jgi:DNA-binding Xre family transcriptional regulator
MHVTDLEKIRENIRFVYQIRRLSQERLADAAGISTTHLNRILRGHVPDVSFRVISLLCRELGYTVGEMDVDPKKFMLNYSHEPAAA